VKRVRRALRRVATAFAFLFLVFLLAAALTARSGDPAIFPATGDDAVSVHFVSHGYHSGLVLPRAALAKEAGRRGHSAVVDVAVRFATYEAIEVGWGDEQFYRHVPMAASLELKLAFQALFRPGNASVLHIVGLPAPARQVFPVSDIVALRLSRDGFGRLVASLDASFAKDAQRRPVHLGPGLYGPSLFYHAVGEFHLFNVCNHWTARLLDAAGVPTAPVLATLPAGLLLDLHWRSGLGRIPAP
jgi:uncharacterized protein (TIGR02117 family)